MESLKTKNIEDTIKVCVRMRPLLWDEKLASIQLDSTLKAVEVSEGSNEDSKSNLPVFLKTSSTQGKSTSVAKPKKKFYYGKKNYLNISWLKLGYSNQ